MKGHAELFEKVRSRTGMYFTEETYPVVAAFVLGYDMACEGGVLSGFREWLVMRVGSGSNLAWSALVLDCAFPDSHPPEEALSAGPKAQRHAIDTLFALLAEFEQERSRPDGLRRILVAFEEWTKRAS